MLQSRSKLIKEFYARRYFDEFYLKEDEYAQKKELVDAGNARLNQTRLAFAEAKETSNETALAELKEQTEKAEADALAKYNKTSEEQLKDSEAALKVARERLDEGKVKQIKLTKCSVSDIELRLRLGQVKG